MVSCSQPCLKNSQGSNVVRQSCVGRPDYRRTVCLNWAWLLRMLRERIDDKPFLGLIDTWLKAGILETDGTVFHPHTGTSARGLPVLLKTLIRKVRGHYNDFRVVGNSRGLWTLYKEVVKLLYKWLNRRCQRRSLTWPKLKRVLERVAFPTPAQQSRQTVNRGFV